MVFFEKNKSSLNILYHLTERIMCIFFFANREDFFEKYNIITINYLRFFLSSQTGFKILIIRISIL
jgi:hypothetical protein